MNKDINREVGVSRPGFVAEQNGKVIASAETFNGLTEKESVKKLLGDKTLLIRHVVPEGTTKVYSGTIAGEMKRVFGDEAKTVHIPMLFVREVRRFIMKIEEAHRRARKSKLHFGAAVA